LLQAAPRRSSSAHAARRWCRGFVTAEELAQQRGRGARLARLASDGIAPTRSELERRFLRAAARAKLPRPEVNGEAGGYEVDFDWPEHRLVVEVDGWRFHGHRLAFERDRAKDTALQVRGWRVLRFTWRQLRDDPAAVMTAVARLFSPRASRRAA
jgi:very-short-patch-repair endonuclease